MRARIDRHRTHSQSKCANTELSHVLMGAVRAYREAAALLAPRADGALTLACTLAFTRSAKILEPIAHRMNVHYHRPAENTATSVSGTGMATPLSPRLIAAHCVSACPLPRSSS